ncbi:hypothetical protein RchiOBHm_Chr7g0231891 [Rosa chinensis]|uniref:Uncharacterized protein n=1 Tax=Rosa chinensis TaxID=74649 RepID=A0A2P6PFS3_ROSCH|nr:hypothetical protein RchiOBHm_Chr7g0231891 [Rosa chinensis]
MPLELSALSIEREPVDDPEIRAEVLEAIYMITLQVKNDASTNGFRFCYWPC